MTAQDHCKQPLNLARGRLESQSDTNKRMKAQSAILVGCSGLLGWRKHVRASSGRQ